MLHQTRLEILTEEHSMKAFLDGLLPRILPPGYRIGENCFVRPHKIAAARVGCMLKACNFAWLTFRYEKFTDEPLGVGVCGKCDHARRMWFRGPEWRGSRCGQR